MVLLSPTRCTSISRDLTGVSGTRVQEEGRPLTKLVTQCVLWCRDAPSQRRLAACGGGCEVEIPGPSYQVMPFFSRQQNNHIVGLTISTESRLVSCGRLRVRVGVLQQ